MDPTDNHGLQVWEHGDRPWSHNEDMEHIEQRLAVRDAEANRSDYTPHDGAIFIATDTGAVYDGDGSSWSPATRGVGHFRLQSDDTASRVYYDEDRSGQPVYFQRDESSDETALTFSGTNVGIGSATSPDRALDVDGIVQAKHGGSGIFFLVVDEDSGERLEIRTYSNTDGFRFTPDPGSGRRPDSEFFYRMSDDQWGSETDFGVEADLTVSGGVSVGGGLDVSGNKNFVHDAGDGTEIVYTSQESGEARTVHEGQATIAGSGISTISLPDHFTTVVSDTDPKLRVQVTPHACALVGVTDRSPAEIEVKVDHPDADTVTVDYRVTGIRDGFEDKEIVRDADPDAESTAD